MAFDFRGNLKPREMNIVVGSDVPPVSNVPPVSKRKTQHLYTRYVGEEFKVRCGTRYVRYSTVRYGIVRYGTVYVLHFVSIEFKVRYGTVRYVTVYCLAFCFNICMPAYLELLSKR